MGFDRLIPMLSLPLSLAEMQSASGTHVPCP